MRRLTIYTRHDRAQDALDTDPAALSRSELAERKDRLKTAVVTLALLSAEVRTGLLLGYVRRVEGWEIWAGAPPSRRMLKRVDTLGQVVQFLDTFAGESADA